MSQTTTITQRLPVVDRKNKTPNYSYPPLTNANFEKLVKCWKTWLGMKDDEKTNIYIQCQDWQHENRSRFIKR